MATTEAKKRYDEKAYDRISILFPKGTKDRIRSAGRTVNGLASKAATAELDRIERGLVAVNIPQTVYDELREYGSPEDLVVEAVHEKLVAVRL